MNELNPLWMYGIIALGLVFACYVAFQHIKEGKIKTDVYKLMSVLKVYKRQLNDFKSQDTRLMDEIRIYEGQAKQRGFEERLIKNVNKETVIVQEMHRVLLDIQAIDIIDELTLEFGYHRNEVSRLAIMQKHIDRLEVNHKRKAVLSQRAMG